MRRDLMGFFGRLLRDRSGAVLIPMAVAMTAVLGFAGLAVDIGHVFYVQNRIQTATDAAALAGAQNIIDGATPASIQSAVASYSAGAGNQNAYSGMPVSIVSGYPKYKCLTSTGVPCVTLSDGTKANAIVVRQSARVPIYLGRIIGFNAMTVTTTATASAAGGYAPPLNIMFVLDSTSSMNTADANCSLGSSTKRIDCALAGVRTILGMLTPSIDYLGLMVFPGVDSTTVTNGYETDCKSSPVSTVVAYSASTKYQIVSMANDFRSSDTASALNTSSPIVRAMRAGGTGCAQGMDVVGGKGTFYADAITAAQTALATFATGARNVQNVIILLSDGDAGADSSKGQISSTKASNQCHQAITAAQTAKTAKTWVYSIAYGASTVTSGSSASCTTDSPKISACSTMQQIASDASRFYSDKANGCTSSVNSVSELIAIFKSIGTSLLNTRLLPDNTV
ncbi:MAG: pilus assembly protein TadG-related protein [Dongiaceae bacterium]